MVTLGYSALNASTIGAKSAASSAESGKDHMVTVPEISSALAVRPKPMVISITVAVRIANIFFIVITPLFAWVFCQYRSDP